MEQAPKRRLIIRKKLVPNEGEQPPTTIPPVTYGVSCTFNPITDTPKRCPCGGYYTSDSEYTPRECCSGLYTHGVHYKLFDGRYTPDYTPADEKQKFYSSFDKPVIYDFTSDKFISITTNTPAKETTSSFNIMPASKLRETQREDKRDSRDSRNTSRDWREDTRDCRNTSRYSREDKRDSRNTSRDWREDTRDCRNTSRDWREDTRDCRNTSRYSREDTRDSRDSRNTSRYSREDTRDSRNTSRYSREDTRDSRNTSRYSREDTRDSRDSRNDRDYHRSRERDYVRNTRVTDDPNSYNGARREPSKLKAGLDSELGNYGRKF
jgi:hypothetical protein